MTTAAITPLPTDQIICVFFIQLCEALNINVLFPFMAFMVEDFGYSGELLGYYVGGLAAAFCSAQFFSSVFWGKVSDIYGRKPSILIGTIGTVFGMLVFGLSKNYFQAVCGRLLAGLLSGNIGVLKTYITEITDDTNRAAGFSYLSVAWACGCIIAPLFGGILSKPVEKFPQYFHKGGFFDEFPFFLPILLCIILLLISIVMCMFFMKETKVFSVTKDTNEPGLSMTTMKSASVNFATVPFDDDDSDEEECFLCRSTSKQLPNTSFDKGDAVISPIRSFTAMRSAISNNNNNSTFPARSSNDYEQVALDKSNHFVIEEEENNEGGEGGVVEEVEEDNADSKIISTSTIDFSQHEPGMIEDSMNATVSPIYHKRKKHVLRERVVVLACCNYMVLCMAFILFDETLPLFLKLKEESGGFSFDSMNIGSLLSAAGLFLLIFATFILPKVGQYSKKALFHYSLIGALVHVFLWPLCGAANSFMLHSTSKQTTEMIIYPILIILLSAKTAIAACAFIASTIQVNHCVHGENLGIVNGFGQALGAFARGVGPALGGVLWSTSTKYNFVYLNFIAVAILWIANLYVNSILPDSLDMKKKRKDENSNSEKENVMEAGEEVTIEF